MQAETLMEGKVVMVTGVAPGIRLAAGAVVARPPRAPVHG
jgi:hypothetical protein